MNDVLYSLMDWPAIESLVYSECDCPHALLGPHIVSQGVLIAAFIPEAKMVKIHLKKNDARIDMECADEGGYFAALLPGKKIPDYTYEITYKNDATEEIIDPYKFHCTVSQKDCERFNAGIHYTIYDVLGAHITTIKNVTGTRFAVWAPNAIRVSVVGDFNCWDGRRHPMRRVGNSGIFELFIPGIKKGDLYKFELKAKGGLTYLKADPYANQSEVRPNTASIVSDSSMYVWEDQEWINQRKLTRKQAKPMAVYEVHLGSFKKPDENSNSFYNYRELAPMLASYLLSMGYTHIELMPVMEHPFDGSWGYQVTGYYSVTSRYGSPEDFKYFVDYMHQQGIGVILDWVPAHFPKDAFALSGFDGTHLYEHEDPRRGEHPHWGTLIFNYGRPEVSNFLIGSALFWLSEYHVDGIRMDAVASMLYLDYGKNPGEWLPNEKGGNENLEAVELLKHINSIVHKRKDGTIMIAEESTAWPKVTGDLNDGGLGFDYKWNMGWMNDYTRYMSQDPLFRKGCHGLLTFSMVYAYSEHFILVLSHDEVVHGKCSMLNKMPGSKKDKFANLRAAYGFMTAHPGKKLLFMGQEFAQEKEWNENVSLSWELLLQEEHKQMQTYVADLNHFYQENKALYELDDSPKGFQWISCLDADHSIVSFIRSGKTKEDTLFVVANFTPVVYDNYVAAVPFAGKYKEVFNSDSKKYGGDGNENKKMISAKKVPKDGQNYSMPIVLPGLSVVIFKYHPAPKITRRKK